MAVFITGASAGIGEATARAFAAAKRDLVLVARRKDRLESLRSELQAQGIRVEIFELDVRDRRAIDALVQKHADVLSTVDVLVNNAGLAQGREPLQEGNPEDWDVMIDTNVKGLLYVTRALLPGLIQKKGHVVNLGSIAGHYTYPSGNVYCATKYAVRALTEALRQDLHGSGVRVTEISPAMVKTDFSEVRFRGDKKKAEAVYAGMDALTPEDIAEAIVWSVQRPHRVNIQEMVIFPTDQANATMFARR